MPQFALSRLGFRQAVWLLPACWALHEAEEWNILDWYQRYWMNVPDMTPLEMRLGLAVMTLAGVIGTAFTLLLKSPRVTAWLALPFFAVLALGNAFQHIYFVFEFGAYSPGVVTSVVLVIPVFTYLTARAVRERLIPKWFPALLLAPVVRSVAAAVEMGNVAPEAIHAMARWSATLAGMAGLE